MKNKLLILMVSAVLVLSLAGCGTSGPELTGNYAGGGMSEFKYGDSVLGMNYSTSDIQLFDDNTYEMTESTIIDMGGTAAGTTIVTSYGEYVKGETSDGYVELTLKAPNRLVYASYSTLGGFAFDYDTNVDTDFIIPGGDDVAIDKDSFFEELGYTADNTLYIVLDSNNNETCQVEYSK